MGVRLDALSATMALMVTGVSFLIHVYSVGYMKDDPGYARYFTLLNLFVFSMLLLVFADNLPLMFVGWEGVGFCSYALIGFWYTDIDNANAGRKAFIVTRIGDVAFGVAIIWLAYFAGTTNTSEINAAAVASMPVATATLIGILLLFGAAGKSAQLPLTVWLPDAMAGPTPVSALIHAATMVTAGIYLLMRLFPVISLSKTAMAVIAGVGAVTALYAATVALVQRDIKKVLAYSTISQIGYMALAVGAGSISASLFHLFTHAFFKALLFMGAGCVIQAMHEEHDIFRMGGLASRMPVVFWSFLAGATALAAAPGTAGFFSKDEVLAAVFAQGTAYYYLLWAMAELTALITTLYIFRVVYFVFLDKPKGEPRSIPTIMSITIVPLAVLSLAGGVINVPAFLGGSEYLAKALASQGLGLLAPDSAPHIILAGITTAVCITGLVLSYYLYAIKPEFRLGLKARYPGIVSFLLAGWRLDGLYKAVFVVPFRRVAEVLWKRVDEGAIDGTFDGIGSSLASAATQLRRSVTGRASAYIMATVIGAAAILVFFAWSSY
jgi:NADH-quinone oxidoreductase subunit L